MPEAHEHPGKVRVCHISVQTAWWGEVSRLWADWVLHKINRWIQQWQFSCAGLSAVSQYWIGEGKCPSQTGTIYSLCAFRGISESSRERNSFCNFITQSSERGPKLQRQHTRSVCFILDTAFLFFREKWSQKKRKEETPTAVSQKDISPSCKEVTDDTDALPPFAWRSPFREHTASRCALVSSETGGWHSPHTPPFELAGPPDTFIGKLKRREMAHFVMCSSVFDLKHLSKSSVRVMLKHKGSRVSATCVIWSAAQIHH